MVLIEEPLVVYLIAVEGYFLHQTHRKETVLIVAEVPMAITGSPGCSLFDTATTVTIKVVEGIIHIIAKAAHRIGAWLCRNFHSFIAIADFA
jgi:hypothetical protein